MNRNIVTIFFEALWKVILYSAKVCLIAFAWGLKLIGTICITIGQTTEKIILKRS